MAKIEHSSPDPASLAFSILTPKAPLMTLNTPKSHANRPQPGDTLLLATHNAGKARELAAALTPFGFQLRTFADEGLASPDETGRTFEANATLKATHGREARACWTLADDSGLEVTALHGAPGVDTAHFGGWEKLLEVLQDTPLHARAARFVCVLALQSPEGETHLFQGICDGAITLEAQGDQGFGYDPVFQPEGSAHTFARMTPEEKGATSHRGRAMAQLTAWLEGRE